MPSRPARRGVRRPRRRDDALAARDPRGEDPQPVPRRAVRAAGEAGGEGVLVQVAVDRVVGGGRLERRHRPRVDRDRGRDGLGDDVELLPVVAHEPRAIGVEVEPHLLAQRRRHAQRHRHGRVELHAEHPARVAAVGAPGRPVEARVEGHRSHARISSPCSSSRGGRRAHRRALAVEAQRRPGERDAVGLGDRLQAELLGERAGLGDVVDRPGRDAGRAQAPRPSGRRGSRREHGVERIAPSSPTCATRAVVGGEALVGGQLGPADRLAQAREQAVVADGDRERPVGGLEGLVGDDARVAVAAPPGRDGRRRPSPSPG